MICYELHMGEICANAVMLRLRMLASRRQFKFIWGETTEQCFTLRPALYSFADEDGVPLDEPKLWAEARIFEMGKPEIMDPLRHLCTAGSPPGPHRDA